MMVKLKSIHLHPTGCLASTQASAHTNLQRNLNLGEVDAHSKAITPRDKKKPTTAKPNAAQCTTLQPYTVGCGAETRVG